MKTLKQDMFVTSAVRILLLMMLVASSEALFFDKKNVTIRNEIPGETINIQCYSSEDNLGSHDLAYGASYSWHFRVNIWGTTKFWCDFTTKHGSGNYGVYTRNLDEVSNGLFQWLVKENGVCLIMDALDNKLYCQHWKKPPSLL
ncbi:hypothetical protein ABFS83_06G094400 [Erythranthe nasuta]